MQHAEICHIFRQVCSDAEGDACIKAFHNSVSSYTTQSSALPAPNTSIHSVHTKLGNEKCFGLIDIPDEGWREYNCRQAVGHLETRHLLCLWDHFTFSIDRQWDVLRPVTCFVRVTAFYCLSKKSQAKHFISQSILKTLAISLSTFPYTTQGSLEFSISCAHTHKFHGWHRPQSSALPIAVILQFSLVCFILPKALVPSEDYCTVVSANRTAK